MRQTRRSRSAATPQKNESEGQTEEVKPTDTPAKANLETVFEKDGKDENADVHEEDGPEPVSEDVSTTIPAQESESSEPNSEEKESAELIEPGNTPSKKPVGDIELSCQVCNCSFTNYHEHMNSEAHKAKINHSNSKTDGQANADAGKGTPKSSTAPQALKRSGEQDSAPSPKRMKSQTNSPAVEKFRCDVCSLSILRKQDYDHHMNGKRHHINVCKSQGKSYCEICKLFFNTITDLNDHTESQLHKKNIAEKKQDKRTFDCEICNISSLAEKQYEQHLSSKRHKRSLERPAGGTTNSTASVQSKTVNGSIEPKVDVSQKKWLYVCNACNFTCNHDQQFSAHMNLADHKAAVTDMKRKGLMLEKDGNKGAANNFQNARKVIPALVGPRATNMTTSVAPKTTVKPSTSGPVASNVSAVQGNAIAPVKQGQMKTVAPQANRKAPVGGPKRNMPMNKPNAPLNKPALNAVGNRSNPRFVGKQGEQPPNKFMPNPPPLKLGFPKMPFDAAANFGPSYGGNSMEQNAGGSFGSYRPVGNYGGDMRADNVNPVSNARDDFRGDVRGDFRGNIRDDYRGEIRDIRNIDLGGDSRGDVGFRAGFYREVPSDAGRDSRDYRGAFRGEGPLDVRSDVRSGLGSDTRGDLRSMARSDIRSEATTDIRGYGNNDIRADLRNDSRSDYIRDRSSLSNYGASAGFGQSYRGGVDDYRSDSYGRGVQSSGSGTPSGNYSVAGSMASGRYDSYMDRSSAAFSNQYAGSSRGYMSDMPLNGR